MTKLVTWNCNMAFRNKTSKILRHEPDILVIQECESPRVKGEWAEFSDWIWVGENEHKGLGIFSRNGISLKPGTVTGVAGRYTVPVTTDIGINILGVWAMNDEQNPKNRYIGRVYTALQEYREWVDSDTLVVGDFNWNRIWDDSPNSPLCGDFSETVQLLNDSGLRSVYHSMTDSAFGEEEKPTFYMHKKQDREYHIDYVFASDDKITSETELTVGEYSDWVELSDHVPIIAEF